MYHYTESGLDNVWLENGYTIHRTPYGKGVSIEDTDGLHLVIAQSIIKKPGRITGKELRFLRTLLGLSQQSLAQRVLLTTEQSVSLWERTGRVPAQADALLRIVAFEKFKGNGKVTEILDRINTVDRLCNQKLVATERRGKWVGHTQSEPEEAVA
ncbi:MAG: transcriptional regulator [Ottowia sp.]|uniref:helix-turn-helix domain-containing protein n=1 Tax=Ottowia sp. TaxID=1898956 RepID=UPI0039E3BB91